MNVLVDGNLTPTMVPRLAAKGVAAVHVAHIGLPGATDPEVWRYAYEHDQVIVTMNGADFLHLAGGVELHPGLVVLRAKGSLSRDDQWAWVEPVIDLDRAAYAPEGGASILLVVRVRHPSYGASRTGHTDGEGCDLRGRLCREALGTQSYSGRENESNANRAVRARAGRGAVGVALGWRLVRLGGDSRVPV